MRAETFISLFFSVLLCVSGCTDNGEGVDTKAKIKIGTIGDVPAVGGRFSLSCTVEGGLETVLVPSSDASWLDSLECDGGELSFSVNPNKTDSEREADITVSGDGCEEAVLHIRQNKADFELFVDIVLTENEEYSVSASFYPDDDTSSYYTGIVMADELAGYPDGASFVEEILATLEAQAEDAGIYLTTLLKRSIVTGESERVFDRLQPGVTYSVYAFSLDVMGKSEGVVFHEDYTAPEAWYPDAVYDIEVTGSTMSSITVRVEPSEPEFPYMLDVIAMTEYESEYGGNADRLAAGVIADTQNIIDYYNSMGLSFSFSDFTRTGTLTAAVMEDLIPGTEYFIYAFGLDDNGLILTKVSGIFHSTEDVVITDDCKFEITFSDVRSSDFDVSVSPSNPDTRWWIQLSLSGILDSNTPDEVAAMFINMAQQSGMDWESSSQIRTGMHTLDTYADLNYAPFDSETEYTVFVFGVNSAGERTTEVAFASCTTGSPESSSMTIDIDISGIGPSTANIRCTPSTDDEFYYSYVIPYEEYSYFSDDVDFMNYVIEQAEMDGTMELVRGLYEYTVDGYYLRSDTEYTAFAFGYSGGVTTPLFQEGFRTLKREFSSASMEISYTVMDGNDIYLQDTVRNYDFKDMAAVVFSISPSEDAGSWYFSGFGNSLSYMQALNTEELIYSIRSNGRANYNKTSVMYAVPWNSRLCGAGFAMDSEGREGEPVLIEAVIPSQI